MKAKLAKIADIENLAKKIKNEDLWELFAGIRRACEAETIVHQTIMACVINHKKHGEAFSWDEIGGRYGGGLVDNPKAIAMLLKQEYLIQGDREGKPILRVMVDFLNGYFARPS